MISGLVFNIQKYSIQDGPGIRTTVFLKGCPLCCPWCHNPEGISLRSQILVSDNRCIQCGECRPVCPQNPANGAERALPGRNEACQMCGACVAACPTEARQVIGKTMTIDDVMREIQQDRIFYEDSSGGVTFSGGEPLMQPDFLAALLEVCRQQEIHTAVDTSGFASRERLLDIARLTGLVLYDLKIMDAYKHRQYTGVANELPLANLRALGQNHPNIWIRVPVIPGINDDESNLDAIAGIAASLPGVRQVNLLPYHNTGAQKFRRLGQTYGCPDVPRPDTSHLERIAGRFIARGLPTIIGG